ncbi:hypothetical protein [Marinobacter bohaiensis]|uniref:hypothetical protein n=1 Tax=Marinobacter bohaiensis TaxID=2201898 RepID=UPI0013A68CEF|nr:hypothetical protein [Marinobacter bohaiensis]
MDRRTFLRGLAGLVAWSWLGRVDADGLDGSTMSNALSQELAALSEHHFGGYASQCSADTLRAQLARAGVISADGIDRQRLAMLAREEPLRVYQGFYYAPTELDLYALAYLTHRPPLGY